MPKLSVIMPVYNTLSFHLKASVESILGQSFNDFEFIIIDDGSKNSPEEIINSYNDPRIRFYKNDKNEGLIYTLNRALDLCQGEYIARMDSDDISLPDRLIKQANFLNENQDISLLGGSIEYFGASKRRVDYPLSHKEIKFAMLKENVIAHPAVMFRKKDFENFRYDSKYTHSEDYELWIRAILTLNFANLPDIILNYRIHKGQVGAKHNIVQQQNAYKTRMKFVSSFDKNFNNHEISLLLSFFDERPSFKNVSVEDIQELMKKVQNKNLKTQFFDENLIKERFSRVLKMIKYPKKRLFSINICHKYNFYIANKESDFEDEKVIFNKGFALSRQN